MKIKDLGNKYHIIKENFNIIIIKPILNNKSVTITLKLLEKLPMEIRQFIIEKIKLDIVRDMYTYEMILETYEKHMYDLIEKEIRKYD